MENSSLIASAAVCATQGTDLASISEQMLQDLDLPGSVIPALSPTYAVQRAKNGPVETAETIAHFTHDEATLLALWTADHRLRTRLAVLHNSSISRQALCTLATTLAEVPEDKFSKTQLRLVNVLLARLASCSPSDLLATLVTHPILWSVNTRFISDAKGSHTDPLPTALAVALLDPAVDWTNIVNSEFAPVAFQYAPAVAESAAGRWAVRLIKRTGALGENPSPGELGLYLLDRLPSHTPASVCATLVDNLRDLPAVRTQAGGATRMCRRYAGTTLPAILMERRALAGEFPTALLEQHLGQNPPTAGHLRALIGRGMDLPAATLALKNDREFVTALANDYRTLPRLSRSAARLLAESPEFLTQILDLDGGSASPRSETARRTALQAVVARLDGDDLARFAARLAAHPGTPRALSALLRDLRYDRTGMILTTVVKLMRTNADLSQVLTAALATPNQRGGTWSRYLTSHRYIAPLAWLAFDGPQELQETAAQQLTVCMRDRVAEEFPHDAVLRAYAYLTRLTFDPQSVDPHQERAAWGLVLPAVSSPTQTEELRTAALSLAWEHRPQLVVRFAGRDFVESLAVNRSDQLDDILAKHMTESPSPRAWVPHIGNLSKVAGSNPNMWTLIMEQAVSRNLTPTQWRLLVTLAADWPSTLDDLVCAATFAQ